MKVTLVKTIINNVEITSSSKRDRCFRRVTSFDIKTVEFEDRPFPYPSVFEFIVENKTRILEEFGYGDERKFDYAQSSFCFNGFEHTEKVADDDNYVEYNTIQIRVYLQVDGVTAVFKQTGVSRVEYRALVFNTIGDYNDYIDKAVNTKDSHTSLVNIVVNAIGKSMHIDCEYPASNYLTRKQAIAVATILDRHHTKALTPDDANSLIECLLGCINVSEKELNEVLLREVIVPLWHIDEKRQPVFVGFTTKYISVADLQLLKFNTLR